MLDTGGSGLSAIITAKAEPWRSWGAHLASFGAQAALVADSPYYKLLIGRVLGYNEDNVLHHVKVGCGSVLARGGGRGKEEGLGGGGGGEGLEDWSKGKGGG